MGYVCRDVMTIIYIFGTLVMKGHDSLRIIPGNKKDAHDVQRWSAS